MSGRRRSIRTTINKPLFASAAICGRKIVPFDAVTVSRTVTKIPGGTVIFLGVTNLIYDSIGGSRSFEVTEERREFSFRCIFWRNRPRSSVVLEDTEGGYFQVTETMVTMSSWRMVELPQKVEFTEEIFKYLIAADFMKAWQLVVKPSSNR